MRYSNSLLKTMREVPSNCEVPSHILMYRTNMVKQESSGLYTYLPYFNMILRKVEDAIRKEMLLQNAQECKFPILVSKELLNLSGRWDAFGPEMFSLHDRHNNEYALSPTNEEAATMIAKQYVKSFRDLPLCVYQINTKHRDEIRPRGIGRTRAFTMKDAYSFHSSEESLDKTYQSMVNGYVRLFKSLGLEAFPVNADNGTMGGSGSQEIMAISNEGDDIVARCPKCGYAANLEVVPCVDEYTLSDLSGNYKLALTENIKTIEDLVDFFDTDSKAFAKSIVYKSDSKEIVVAVVRGDREINEVKLRNLLKAQTVELATLDDISSIGSCLGFVGPIGLKENVTIIVDNEVKSMSNFIVGANKKDYHYINVNCLDFDKCQFADIRTAVQGDKHSCGGTVELVRAVELGHCFKLGKRYTERLNALYTDTDGELKTMTMGCYGIGLERTVSSIIDQYHDERGICWPMSLAPLKVSIISTKKEMPEIGETLYQELLSKGVDVLIDDRKVTVGVKFKDSDLLGIPLKVIIGRKYEQEGVFEIEYRNGDKLTVPADNIVDKIIDIINTEINAFNRR